MTSPVYSPGSANTSWHYRAVMIRRRGQRAASAVGINAVVSVLDPIIFGVIAPTPPRPAKCLWYPLVAWRW